jgi:hypothetical protein
MTRYFKTMAMLMAITCAAAAAADFASPPATADAPPPIAQLAVEDWRGNSARLAH